MFIIPVGATTISIRETHATRNYLGKCVSDLLENTLQDNQNNWHLQLLYSYQESTWRVLSQWPLGNWVFQSHTYWRHHAVLPERCWGRQCPWNHHRPWPHHRTTCCWGKKQMTIHDQIDFTGLWIWNCRMHSTHTMVVLTDVKFVLVLIQRPTVWSALVSAFHPPLSRLLPH